MAIDSAVMTVRARFGEARRYLTVGLICAALHNALVISASWLGLYYMLALLLSFALVNPLGYLLNSHYTFGAAPSWSAFFRFMGGLVAGTLISAAIMFLLCSVLNLPVFIATPVTTLLLLAWNYCSARWAIQAAGRLRG